MCFHRTWVKAIDPFIGYLSSLKKKIKICLKLVRKQAQICNVYLGLSYFEDSLTNNDKQHSKD